MAATVLIREKNGAGETATDKTSGTIRFKNADDATVNTTNPMVVPSSPGYDYSYEKWIRMNVSGGTYTEISNPRLYSDGNNGMGTGVEVYAKAVGSFVQPAEATSTAGYTNLFSYTSGAALDMDGNNAGPFTGTGDKGDYAVMIMRVAETASGGVTPSETITLAWDEI